MAEYTIELRHVVQNHNIFDFNYPFYDENKRSTFERDFIRHFYFREIGSETIDRFKLLLEDKMRTVFPYYNELFRTAQVEYSILDNYDITETTTMERKNVGKSLGEIHAVGQIFNDQSTETNEDKTASRNGSGMTSKDNSQNENETHIIGRTTVGDETNDKESIKRFLDTPQGKLDLSDNKYLTTLNHDSDDITLHKEATESESKASERQVGGREREQYLSQGDETGNTKTTNTFNGEERSTTDNNTRTSSEGT